MDNHYLILSTLNELKTENARLKREVEKLQNENFELRKQLAEKQVNETIQQNRRNPDKPQRG